MGDVDPITGLPLGTDPLPLDRSAGPPLAPPVLGAPSLTHGPSDPFALGAPGALPPPTLTEGTAPPNTGAGPAGGPAGLPPAGVPIPQSPGVGPAGGPPIDVVTPPSPATPQTFAPAVKTSYAVETKKEAGLNKELTAAQAAEQKAAGATTAAKVGGANAEVAAADQAAKDAAAAQEQRKAAQAVAQQKYDAGAAELDRQRQATIKAGAKGYWEDRGAGAQVASALLAGIGQFAAALTGGPNAALGVINTAIERDATAKREKTRAELERLGVKGQDLKDALARADIEIQNGMAAAKEASANRREALLARAKVPLAQAQGDEISAGLRAGAAKDALAAQVSLRRHVEVDTEPAIRAAAAAAKPLVANADQNKAAGFGERMLTQLDTVRKLPPLSKSDRDVIQKDTAYEAALSPEKKALLMAAGQYKTVEQKLSDAGRSYYRAMREFASANLRRESGAAISASEVADAMARYGPVMGDKPADIKSKQSAMESAAHSALREAGPAAASVRMPVDASKIAPGDIARLNRELATASPQDAARIRGVLARVRH